MESGPTNVTNTRTRTHTHTHMHTHTQAYAQDSHAKVRDNAGVRECDHVQGWSVVYKDKKGEYVLSGALEESLSLPEAGQSV